LGKADQMNNFKGVLAGSTYVLFIIFLTITVYGGSPPNITIMKGGVGDIRLGLQWNEILKKYPGQTFEVTIPREDLPTGLLYTYEDGNYVILEFNEKHRVSSIMITSPTIRTKHAIGVGNTLQEVMEKYPKAKLGHSAVEGGHISLYDKTTGCVFYFDIKRVPFELLEAKKLDINKVKSQKVVKIFVVE
jgi:hypothetical protein